MATKFICKFNMDNDAFAESPSEESKRILDEISRFLRLGNTARKIVDSNGNVIGQWEIADDDHADEMKLFDN